MVITSVLTLLGLGFAASVILAVASRVFHVEEDPRVEAVMEALPGANCGGCGYAGCEGYAVAVVNDAHISAALCVAGSAEVTIAVGELTGKTVAASDPLISFRRCDKLAGKVGARYDYQGMPSCAAATLLMGGSDVCSWSCLGFGDCVEICPFSAMEIQDGLVHINLAKCTGCGMCVKACPRSSLEMIPARARIAVVCATKDKLRAVMEVCEVGCINCAKCIKVCPAKAISNVDGRIFVDHQRCLSFGTECEEVCLKACGRNILRPLRPGLQDEMHAARLQELEIQSIKAANTENKADTQA